MRRGKFFKIDNGMNQYICQTGSLDMYKIMPRGGMMHLLLSSPAYPEAAIQAKYTVETLDEEDLWDYDLWKGSFYKTRAVK